MASVAEKFSAQLHAFSHSQLAKLKPAEINRITSHQMIATAFFSGATLFFARQLQAQKAVYMAALKQLLMTDFGLAEKNAAGLIESNARLYKRYRLIENAFNSGWQSAQGWTLAPEQGEPSLHALLKKYHDLSMSNLHIEGIKEPKDARVVVEEIVETVATPAAAHGRRPLWPGLRALFILALLALVSYALLFPQQLPGALRELAQALHDNAEQLLRRSGIYN